MVALWRRGRVVQGGKVVVVAVWSGRDGGVERWGGGLESDSYFGGSVMMRYYMSDLFFYIYRAI